MNQVVEVLDRDAEALTLGLSREDFAELIVGGFDAWCAVVRGSLAQQRGVARDRIVGMLNRKMNELKPRADSMITVRFDRAQRT